jgi:uncharacterized protein (TIGR03437 family)
MLAGTYTGSVRSYCCINDQIYPVTLVVSPPPVSPQGPPLIYYQGVVDNATFAAGNTLAQGDIAVVFGEQLSLGPPAQAAGQPLPTTLGGATVLVNGQSAPLYYASSNQITFQVPSSGAPGGALVQVARDGQAGNTVSVSLAQRAPRIVAVTDLNYNRFSVDHPAKAGTTVIIWAIGLGPTTPSVPDGAPAPTNPPAVVTSAPAVTFEDSGLNPWSDVTPGFAGLSPGVVGLYQVAATIPAATGIPSYYPLNAYYVKLQIGGASSNLFAIDVAFSSTGPG